VPAADAVHVDTTHKSIDEVVEEVERIVKQGLGIRD
jgi:cytidylate kinase